MIRRVELVNFMSHARTVIEPADGLTVLVGPNNCGKSAVVAALQILCHNDNSTYVTRHEQKECSISVETADGHTVVWRRKTAPRYEIDGKTFDRLARSGVPDDLHAVLRMPKVSAEGGQEFDVHFGEQKSPLFLIDKPGSHAAQFFASSSDAAKFVEMQKRHQAKMADARRERTQKQAEAEKLATTLAVLEPVETLGPGVLRVEWQHAELERSTAAIERLTRELAAVRDAGRAAERLSAEADALSPLRAPPALADAMSLDQHLRDARRVSRECAAHSGRAVALRPLAMAPDFGEARVLGRLVENLRAETRAVDHATADCRATHTLAPPPPLHPAADLCRTVEKFGRRQNELAAIEDRLTVIAGLTPVPAQRATGELERCAGDMARAAADVRTCEQGVIAATRALDDGHAVLRQWADRRQTCPTCGGAIDADRLIASSVAAGAARG